MVRVDELDSEIAADEHACFIGIDTSTASDEDLIVALGKHQAALDALNKARSARGI